MLCSLFRDDLTHDGLRTRLDLQPLDPDHLLIAVLQFARC
jgi:hypothetical protein